MQKSKIVKVSQEQAREMIHGVVKRSSIDDLDVRMRIEIVEDATLKNWRENGFVEESILEEARFLTNKMLKDFPNIYRSDIKKLFLYYEKTVEELLNKIDELT